MYHDPYLAHYGVKGMKWGVRKDRESSGLNDRLSLSRKTKNGEVIRAVQDKTPLIPRAISRYSKSLKKQIDNTKNMTLFDESGGEIGNLQLFHESPTSVNVTWLGVNENRRGRGYARAAMEMAEDYARKSGATQMTLEVPGHSPDARHIYESMGFVSQGAISDPDDVWGGLTAMKKKLD